MVSTRFQVIFHCLVLLATEGINCFYRPWYSTLYFCTVVFVHVHLMFTCVDLVMVRAWCCMPINCRVLSAIYCVDVVLQLLQSCMVVFLHVYLMFTCIVPVMVRAR